MNFDDAFTLLIGNEEGYANDPKDPGGETMWGVTARVARAWGYTGAMRDLSRDTAKAICKQHYWDPLRLDELAPSPVVFHILEASYNGGHPVLWMQQAAGAKADGILGPATLAAVRACDPRSFIMRFIAVHQGYYTSLKTWPDFGRGWVNRMSLDLIIGAQ